MRILQVIPYFSPKRGGDVNACYNISKYLARRGHKITIITTDFEFDPLYARSIENENIKVISFHCVANCGMFLITPDIRCWLKDNIHNYDAIHMHSFRSYQNNLVRYYAKKHNIDYFLQAHGSVLPIFQKRRLKQLYDLVWGFRILRDASRVIALTEEEANQYRQMGVAGEKIKVIPNGIDLLEYETLPEKGSFRKKYHIGAEEKLILYLGRIHKIKGIALLIDSFSALEEKNKNIKLVIVGPDGGHLQVLKKQIEDQGNSHRILITGPLYGNDKISAYVDADVYVLPSVYETFPICVLESWACCTPVIVTDRCGIAEYIIDSCSGLTVPYERDRLTGAILRILNDDRLKQSMGKQGEVLVKNKFNWGNIVENIENIFTS